MIHQINDEVLRVIVRARRASGATTRTIKNDLTALSSVLGYAQEEGWIEINPTLSFRTRRSLRDKFVPIKLPQKASIDMMLAASPSRFGDAQEFARETGMREEEIFGLKHTSIDLGRGNVTIFGKRDHVRVIVLTQRARSIVARQPRNIRSPYVFWHSDGQRWVSPGSRFGDIRRRVAQKAAQSKIEFEPFCFHHLRHLFAVEYLLNERGSVYALQKILGHNSIKTTERYLAHVTHDVDSRTKHGVT